MKRVKLLSLIAAFSFLILILTSCAPSGTQPAQGWSGTTFNNGIIYAGSMDGKIMAVNSSTRNLEWSHTIATRSSGGMSCGQTSIPAAIYGTPTVDGGSVYIGTYGGKVLALNTSARIQNLPFPQLRYGEWEWDCPRIGKESNAIVASPVVDENAIYIASSNGRIYSLDKEYGDLNWKSVVLGEKLWTPPVIEGDTIYVSTFDGYIYTLPAKGASPTKDVEPSWAFKADVGFVSSPAIGEETDIIFAGSFDNNLYAIKIGSSEPLRSFPGSKWFWGTPIINEGILYAGCLDGKIYAIDADSGKEVWKEPFDAESPIVASPLLVDGSLVVAAESGNVYVINSKTGTGERIKNPGNDNRPSIDTRIWASLCANEGVVYVRGQDNCLYALDIEKGWISWKLSL